jgi:iron(III) transport system ATP-binding protein
MVYVTHDQSEAMALATDVAVMSEGRLLQVATPAEIYARPEGRLVGGLIGRGAILSLPISGDAKSRLLDWTALRHILDVATNDGSARADILVRPEDVVANEGGIACVVQSSLYEGERYALHLALPDGQSLRAFSRFAVAPGEKLTVAIRAAWRL